MEQPVKYVNHDVAESLDSTDSFEGPEKLLELWFEPREHPSLTASRGLLDVPRQVWEPMLDQVHCKVLSVLSYSELDAYVLSESSFFVYKSHLILKTCGTTTLLEGLGAIIEIVAKYTSLSPSPIHALYSHRGFLFPEKQMHPHCSWEDEAKVLRDFFPHGKTYSFGDRPEDSWYLFMSNEDSSSNSVGSTQFPSLELMMTDLDPVAASQFYSGRTARSVSPASSYDGANSLESSVDSLQTLASSVGAEPDDDDPGHIMGNIMTRATEIDDIYPTSKQVVDSFAFSPCGYSCNGVVNSDKYFTIHVTPESGFSYASFESNVPAAQFGVDDSAVISRVLKIFQPKQFTVVVFDNGEKAAYPYTLPDYKLTSKALQENGEVRLLFMNFVKATS